MILGEWRVGKKAPFKVIRGSGAAIINGNVVYFMSSFGQVFSFNFFTQKWNKLPKCPYWCSSLAVIRGLPLVEVNWEALWSTNWSVL